MQLVCQQAPWGLNCGWGRIGESEEALPPLFSPPPPQRVSSLGRKSGQSINQSQSFNIIQPLCFLQGCPRFFCGWSNLYMIMDTYLYDPPPFNGPFFMTPPFPAVSKSCDPPSVSTPHPPANFWQVPNSVYFFKAFHLPPTVCAILITVFVFRLKTECPSVKRPLYSMFS